MKTLNLNALTVRKNGEDIVLNGVTDKEEVMELIATVDITEPINNLNITVDNNGNPFRLKAVRVFCTGCLPTDDSSAKLMRITTKQGNLDITGSYYDGWRTSKVQIFDSYQKYGFWEATSDRAPSLDAYNSSLAYSTPTMRLRSAITYSYVDSIVISTNSPIKAGASINIYGVKA